MILLRVDFIVSLRIYACMKKIVRLYQFFFYEYLKSEQNNC